MHVEVHSERTDHQRMPAPMRLECDAPIGRHAAEQPGRAEWVGTQRVLLSESEGSIARHFEIKQVIDEGVGTDAADMRGKRALDHRLAAGRGSERRYGVGERPR